MERIIEFIKRQIELEESLFLPDSRHWSQVKREGRIEAFRVVLEFLKANTDIKKE